jgi:hypothetical protein
MTIVTESILVESKSARDLQLAEISHHRAIELIAKVKSLYFALWQGTGIATTEQLAEFFEIESPATLRKVLTRHQEEFESDGVKTLRGKALKDVRDILSLTSSQANLTIWTPRSTLRLAMLLRDSEVAKTVRTSLLDIVEKVVPKQVQEVERLKLELELVKTQERLLATTNAIATTDANSLKMEKSGVCESPVYPMSHPIIE